MLISRKRFEAELKKARDEGFHKAAEQRWMDDRFREVRERIARLEDAIALPNTIGFKEGERKC
jgi:hypothetical protein